MLRIFAKLPSGKSNFASLTPLNGKGGENHIELEEPWRLKRSSKFCSNEFGFLTHKKISVDAKWKPNHHLKIRSLSNSGNLFSDENIGAEHGEGFATFRPSGELHVDVDFLNDRMKKRGLERIRNAMRPDEAFGLIFSFDNVLVDTRIAKLEAWRRLAKEEDKCLDETRELIKKINVLSAEKIIRQILFWSTDDEKIHFLKNRLSILFSEEFEKLHYPMDGLKQWLKALKNANVSCAVSSSLQRSSLIPALERMGIKQFFYTFVTEEDGMSSIAHRFLSAAVKLDRPPSKCIVFEDDPKGIAAAHNCSMKAIAIIGCHPAYELTQADLAVSNFSELSVINLRRLFAVRGSEFMDLQKQRAEKNPDRRKLRNDTIF